MKRSIVITGTIFVLVLLLVGAAFVSVRMFKDSEESQSPSASDSEGRVMKMMTNTANGSASFQLQIEPSPDLPDEPSEASGILVRREDNSLFVGTGDLRATVVMDASNSSQPQISLDHSGPEVEVVVGHDSIIYEDVTDLGLDSLGTGQSGERTIQQEIKQVDTLDKELGRNVEIEVWGERRGDRIIAKVLVFREMNDFVF